MITETLQRKIDHSIDLLRRAEGLALRMHPDGFHLAFSGGKDSQVLYHIAQMAGVKFKAHMQVTTIDPPELMAFVRNNYPEVELHRPPLNFYKLLEQKGTLPTRQVRWCCEKLKEHAGVGTVTLVGVRAAESARRAKLSEVGRIHRNPEKRRISTDLFDMTQEQQHRCIGGRDKIVLSPIFHWTDTDVWQFIRSRGIAYCELYDQGWTRVGCIMCPMARKAERYRERALYPGFERAIVRSIERILQSGRGLATIRPYNPTAQEVFDWWLSGKSIPNYFGMIRNQTKIEF